MMMMRRGGSAGRRVLRRAGAGPLLHAAQESGPDATQQQKAQHPRHGPLQQALVVDFEQLLPFRFSQLKATHLLLLISIEFIVWVFKPKLYPFVRNAFTCRQDRSPSVCPGNC